MAVGGQYTVQLRAILDTKGVLAQIAQIQKQAGRVMIGGGARRAGAGYAAMGKEANRTAAGVRRLGGAVDDTNRKVRRVGSRGNGSQFSRIGNDANKATAGLKSFGATTLDVTKKVVQFGAVTAVIRGVTQGIGSMVQQTFELDKSLTEFKKVSDLSGKGLERYTKQAYELGGTVAKTGVEMIDAATEFRKAGYNDQDAMQLGKIASMYQNVADQELSAGEAANFITSQMKAYNIEAKDAEHIIDAVNEVSNNFAVSSADIAVNIGKASAALAQGNISYEQSIGLMTAMTEITRNGSTAARGLVSIQSRFNQITDETSSTGKKLTAWYEKHNIAIRDQNGNLRSFFEVGKDVSKIWNQLSKDEQMYYLNTQAGANQSRNLAALMRNYETAINATDKALRSENSAARENAKYLDSLEGRLQSVKSAWSKFSNEMVNSDSIKGALSGLAKALEFLSSDFGQAMIKAGSAVGVFVGAVKLLNAVRGAKAFTSLVSGAGVFAREMGVSTKALGKFKRALGGMSSASLLGLAAVTGVIAYGMYDAYKKTHKYRNEVKELSKANEENIRAIDENAESAEFYANKIEELSKVEDKTNAEKERMAAYVEKLNELLPDLNLEYDKETDTLNKTTEAVREYIKAKQEEAKIKAYQENFEKSLKKQVELEEKRKDAIKEMERAQKQYDSALAAAENTGYVDPQVLRNYETAKTALKDITEAYIESSKEVAKQNNNMLVASGDWNTMANKAKTAGWEITKSLQDGLDSGTYLIPETMEGLESLISFDEIANKLNVTDTGKSLVNALQQGMRDGDIDINNALRIADQMQDLSSIMSKEGKASIEELSDQFTRGEIDFTTLQNGIKNALAGIDTVELTSLQRSMSDAGKSASDVADRIREISKANPEAKITINGVELAEEQVDTVLDYLDKVDGDDPEATVNVDGTEVAVKDIDSVEDLISRFNGSEYTASMTLEGGEQAAHEAKTTQESASEFEGRTYTSTMELKGGKQVANEAGDATSAVNRLPKTKRVSFTSNAPATKKQFDEVRGSQDSIKTNKPANIAATVTGKGLWDSLKSVWDSIQSKTVTITARKRGSVSGVANGSGGGHPDPGHASGISSAPEGFAEVNERGWEFIRDAKTGQLRVAGGGERTLTYLNKGDTVYTHAKSKRMINKDDTVIPQFAKGKKGKKGKSAQEIYNDKYNAILTRYNNRVEWANNQKDINHYSDSWLANKKKAYKKRAENELKALNKRSKKVKKKNLKQAYGVGGALRSIKYDTSSAIADDRHSIATKGIESYFDWNMTDKVKKNAITNLNKQRKAKKISADEYTDYLKQIKSANAEYNMSLYEKGSISYNKMLNVLKSAYAKGKGYTKEYYEALDQMRDKEADKASENIENAYMTPKAYKKLTDNIATLKKQGKITAKQYNELYSQLAKKNIDYMMTSYEYGKKSYASMLKTLKNYYNNSKITSQEYYDYVSELAGQQMEKEKERLSKLQERNSNTYNLGRAYVERQIKLLEEQNDLIQKQSDLEKARSQKIKIYRQGIGFVYEQDVEAVREATKAVEDLANPDLKAWKDILELFDDLEEQANIKDLENKVGANASKLFGKYGNNIASWTKWIKNNLATNLGYQNIIDKMEDINYYQDIINYLDNNGLVSSKKISAAINKNRFATGTLNAPAGFARVAEAGYEIALLSKGDAVMPHEISENLMAWGSHSPIEYASAMASTTSNMYHFDKLVLPNVTNASSLLDELNNLPNKALQYSRSRV